MTYCPEGVGWRTETSYFLSTGFRVSFNRRVIRELESSGTEYQLPESVAGWSGRRKCDLGVFLVQLGKKESQNETRLKNYTIEKFTGEILRDISQAETDSPFRQTVMIVPVYVKEDLERYPKIF